MAQEESEGEKVAGMQAKRSFLELQGVKLSVLGDLKSMKMGIGFRIEFRARNLEDFWAQMCSMFQCDAPGWRSARESAAVAEGPKTERAWIRARCPI